MPTKRQLHKIWVSQFKFFGGSGQPKHNYEGGVENNGLTVKKHTDIPVDRKANFKQSKGTVIATIAINPETNDFQLEF